MIQMMVVITLFVDVDVATAKEAEEELRNTDDSDLWVAATEVQYEYEVVDPE
jgi:hypothetical protein